MQFKLSCDIGYITYMHLYVHLPGTGFPALRALYSSFTVSVLKSRAANLEPFGTAVPPIQVYSSWP